MQAKEHSQLLQNVDYLIQDIFDRPIVLALDANLCHRKHLHPSLWVGE
jgi:hypothetical protein